MDLAPLSFQASLEEQWDEEEETQEIETVLKVVPPAYHQYLDVFFKVKAEKPPLHCACDHHIKLEALSHFQVLKEAFTTAPFLSHLNTSLPTIVETDAFDYALGAVLSQVNDSGKNPIAFDSCKLLPDELNYEFYEKELLGIVRALKHWRYFLLSLSNSLEVLTDHYSLKYLMASQVITHFKAHCAEVLSEFHFTITYFPGRLATLPEALSHWHDVYPERGVDSISKTPPNFHQVIKQDGIQESILFSIKVEIFSDLVEQIQKEKDSPSGEVSTKLQSVKKVVKEELESEIRIFKKYADRNRTIPPDFQPGDKVWPTSKNIKTARPTKKLSERWLGPFEVLKKIGSHAYHLKLPLQWKNQFPPPPAIVEEQEEWEVAQVLDSKLKRGKLWYLVEWKGFSEDQERKTWEPDSDLTSSPELVKDFN
ncbi:hypothetical protein O181_007385 [Austropuccinia psidii MF-1]|uniref:Chromo domain-containing protein n=1 Tax=Austropuccinia psidii MF-1 TaxID=1389203 RepID=A0A9Q3BMU4_9BASI|nr:hypothetical protein [Austropuccinia psidii MF-1]